MFSHTTTNMPIPRALLAIWVCTLAAVFYCYEYYLRVAPSVMQEALMYTYNLSHADLGVLSGLFYWAYMPVQVPVGLLMDKYGPRIVLTAACVICALGTFAFANANSLALAYLGRFLIGFGSAFAFVGFLSLSANWLPATVYAPMVGFCMLLGMLGATGGEVLMVHLMQHHGWEHTLHFSAWTGIGLTALLWFGLRDSPSGRTTPTTSTKPAAPSIWHGLSQVVRNGTLWNVGLIGCFTFMPLSAFAELWGVPFLQVAGHSKAQAAFSCSMLFIGFGVGGPIWGFVSTWLQSRKRALCWGALGAGVCLCIALLYPTMPTWGLNCLLFGSGVFTSAEILVFAVGHDLAPKSVQATAVSFVNMVVMLGGVVLQPVIGLTLDILAIQSPPFAQAVNYQIALAVVPIGLFAAALLTTRLPETFAERK